MSFFVVLFSLAFVLTHIGMTAEPFRKPLEEKLGDVGFKGVYSLISLITLGGAIFFFMKANRGLDGAGVGGQIFYLPYIGTACALICMLVAVPLLVFGFVQQSPTGMVAKSYEPKPIHKITRHPVNMGLALFGLGHTLALGTTGDVALFGSIFIVGFFGAFHQDARKAKALGAPFEAFQKQTSILPFAALITRDAEVGIEDFNKVLLGVCLAVYVGLILLHGKLFGVGVF